MKIDSINIEIVQNGVIARVSRHDDDKKGEPGCYKEEKMVFNSIDQASQWIKGNVTGKVKGNISEALGIETGEPSVKT